MALSVLQYLCSLSIPGVVRRLCFSGLSLCEFTRAWSFPLASWRWASSTMLKIRRRQRCCKGRHSVSLLEWLVDHRSVSLLERLVLRPSLCEFTRAIGKGRHSVSLLEWLVGHRSVSLLERLVLRPSLCEFSRAIGWDRHSVSLLE